MGKFLNVKTEKKRFKQLRERRGSEICYELERCVSLMKRDMENQSSNDVTTTTNDKSTSIFGCVTKIMLITLNCFQLSQKL